MAYCTRADLVARFGEREINDLLDRNNDGADDSNALSLVIADVSSEIDGYLGSKYSVPLDDVPQAVTAIACDMVRYKLFDDRAPEEIRKRYEDATSKLTKYAKGVMVLSGVTPATDNPSGGVDYYAEERIFTRDTFCGY